MNRSPPPQFSDIAAIFYCKLIVNIKWFVYIYKIPIPSKQTAMGCNLTPSNYTQTTVSHYNKSVRDCMFPEQSTILLCVVCVFEEASAHHSSFDKCFYL